MIIRNLDLMDAICLPDETDPIPVVNANAVLSLSITPQQFEPVSRGNAPVGQCASAVKQ
jgi:hypothetical protein